MAPQDRVRACLGTWFPLARAPSAVMPLEKLLPARLFKNCLPDLVLWKIPHYCPFRDGLASCTFRLCFLSILCLRHCAEALSGLGAAVAPDPTSGHQHLGQCWPLSL